MRIRKRQVRLPPLSQVPLSDLKTTGFAFTDPAVLEEQQVVVQLHQQQPQSSSTQQPAAEHDDQYYYPPVVAPLSSTAHDQSDQPTYQHHEETTTHGDPSDLGQKEGGRMITMEEQKVVDGEPVDHQVDNHDHDHGRKLRQEMLNKNHDLTKCCTNTISSSISKQQGGSDAAAKSSESSTSILLAADNKFLINPHHCPSTSQGAYTSAHGEQMPAVGCDGYYSRCCYYYCCQELEKSIPLKKRRGSCCCCCYTTTAPIDIAEYSDVHKTHNHQKLVEDSKKNKKMTVMRNTMAILCKSNEKGNDLQQQVVNRLSESAGIQKMSAAATVGAVAARKTRDKKRGGGSTSRSIGAYNIIEGGGSRCSRVNGRSWRCNQPTLVGYSLCQHHLGQGRRRQLITSTRKQPLKKEKIKTMKKKKLPSESFAPATTISMPSSSTSSSSDIQRVKSIKSRSLSSLLGQMDNAIAGNPADNNVQKIYDLNA